MKISEVYPEYVFQRIQKYRVDAVDFKRMTYHDLSGQTVNAIKVLIARADKDKDVKFFQIEPDEE